MLHTILGANGVIGRELSHSLAVQSQTIRQVSRAPRRVNATDELFPADLLDANAVAAAVAGSDIAYLVAGLQYNTKVWQEEWPRVMRNTIDACAKHRVRLVFFDNVYAYGLVRGPMTEDTPLNPSSRKGQVRARIATALLDSVRRGDVQALIVRSADFYGPGAIQSFTHAAVFQRVRAGKAPQWLGNPDAAHTFTFTPDAGQATAVLAQSSDAYGQTWHVPTSREPMNGREFARLVCELAGVPNRLQVAPRWVLRLMGVFVPVLRENQEMMYQFEHDYRFDSSKTEARWGLTPTPYRKGVAATLEKRRD